ncbi:MAG: RsmB/NOP family class I SAM-dependent RNA methyltransferase [Treponema sp.]|nr:RsmB/NOP family class I SAM-dependent RNA methyltransferase [Treponema sp.]
MKQNQKAEKLRGADGFESYYGAVYGERWNAIKGAFEKEPRYVTYNAGSLSGVETAPYYLDAGSVRAAVSLPLKGARHILDMCAAPGGKTLVLASCMDENATLLSNERSADRRARLSRVCDESLPPDVRTRVTVSGNDGAVMCRRQTECFDRILLDAPCSSERHVLADEKYLSEWSPARIKTLAVSQWALLSSAWRMLEPDGYLLYSTCALAPEENDGVIARLFKKFDDAESASSPVALDVTPFCSEALPEPEPTAFGAIVLPDVQQGAGPLYFSLLHKKY